jgi:hypothetical protein
MLADVPASHLPADFDMENPLVPLGADGGRGEPLGGGIGGEGGSGQLPGLGQQGVGGSIGGTAGTNFVLDSLMSRQHSAGTAPADLLASIMTHSQPQGH